MIRIETTTYGESVISTPSWEISPPSGPMQNGTTYMTRPRMQPSKIPAKVLRISSGAIQLLVGPASCLPLGADERAVLDPRHVAGVRGAPEAVRPQLGFSRVKVPFSTSRLVSRSHSASEPSHQTTASGLVSSAISPTHPANSGSLVAACLSMGALSSEDGGLAMAITPGEDERTAARTTVYV